MIYEIREHVLFLGSPGTGESHLAEVMGRAAIQLGYRVMYREAHMLPEELAEAWPNRFARRANPDVKHSHPAKRGEAR